MRDAETMLAIIRETRQEGSAPGGRLSTTLQPGPVPAGLRAHLSKRRGDDPRVRQRKPWTGCPWGRSRTSSRLSATSVSMDPRATHVTSRRRNGKLRPLGIPTWSDKLLQEVMRSILEAYYEPQFSDHSHGFRPDADATRPCTTSTTPGTGRSGSSRVISKDASTTSTTRSCCRSSARRSTTTAS